jgi:uncharacterized membrane protein YcjF (UPF0283 family)
MRCRDTKNQFAAQRDALSSRPAENDDAAQMSASSPDLEAQGHPEQTAPIETPPSRMYPCISTERIMRAVEQQRRITQQLEHLQAQQQERNKLLRITVPMFLVGVVLSSGILTIILVVLSFFQPEILVGILALLSGSIAVLVAIAESLQEALALIPSNSWLLSGAALAVVLMMGMWLRLMRTPHEV